MRAIRPATPADVAGIRSLLVASGLPIADLDVAAIDFIVADEDGRLAGVVGVERFGGDGLLRSLAVTSERRGTGVGDALLHAADAHARSLGMTGLVLLTTTAGPFFARRGYTVIDRDVAPMEVRSSAEFRSICPASVTCMTKLLDSRT
jgi:amino-acid N-acetyltransferase